MDKRNPKAVIKELAESLPGGLNPDDSFLDDLRKLTGFKTVPEMVRRFQELAGIKGK